jgi:DNA-binding GntR family transcriptional regulator
VVYDTLVDMIIQFELLPGERLVESELAARLNVSKTPVREALALLEADGLVETESYKGAKVRWLSRVEMDEQIFLVDALEEPAFPLVIARTTKAEMAAVGQLVGELKRARRRSDGRAYGRLMVEVHKRLFRAAGYPRLEKLITLVVGPLSLRYDRLFVYPFDDAWDTQLSLIERRYEALRDGDADRAVEVVRRHRVKLRQMSDARLANPEIARHFRD